AETVSRPLYAAYGWRGQRIAAASESEEPAERGCAVERDIDRREYEAREGTSRVVQYAAAGSCAECGGVGFAGDPEPGCPECGGAGQVVEVADVADEHLLRFEPCSTCETEICPRCGGSGREESPSRLRVR